MYKPFKNTEFKFTTVCFTKPIFHQIALVIFWLATTFDEAVCFFLKKKLTQHNSNCIFSMDL